MSDKFKLSLCDGKYEYEYDAGKQTVWRNSERWDSMNHQLVGNKFVYSLAVELDETKKQLEAAQARKAQLREAMAEVETRYRALLTEKDAEAEKYKTEGDMYGWNFHMGAHSGAVNTHLFLTQLIKLLALPHDASALKERLKAERERCAKVCEEIEQLLRGNALPTGVEFASAIRSLGDEQ